MPRGHVSEPTANSVTTAKGIFLIYSYIIYQEEGELPGLDGGESTSEMDYKMCTLPIPHLSAESNRALYGGNSRGVRR